MKIVALMTHYCPWNNSICSTLSDLGHDVYTFDFLEKSGACLTKDYDTLTEDIKNFKMKYKGSYLIETGQGVSKYLFYTPLLRKIAHSVKADLILSLYGGGFGLMAYLSGIRPYAVYVVGSDVLLAGSIRQKINRRVLGSAAAIFANGEYLAERALQQAPGSDIRPLLIGTDLTKLKKCDFSRRPIQIVCTRSFSSVYNNEAIIRALALLPDGLNDFKMVFVSGGPTLGECIALTNRILSPERRKQVQFLGGTRYETVLDELSRSHIFVSASRSDGTSTAILEAMGTGLYPILSDIPQNRIFSPGGEQNARFVPLDDDRALADALRDALEHIDTCARYTDYNRELIKRIGDADRNRKILVESLERMVKRYGRTL